jgi:hypothetical protein
VGPKIKGRYVILVKKLLIILKWLQQGVTVRWGLWDYTNGPTCSTGRAEKQLRFRRPLWQSLYLLLQTWPLASVEDLTAAFDLFFICGDLNYSTMFSRKLFK